MQNEFEILQPAIFPKDEIISGVTKRNLKLFPDKGFTISNLDYFSEDEITKHRKYLAKELGFKYEQLKFQKQVHEAKIQIVTPQTQNDMMSDGMMAMESGIVLNVSIADCLAILIYDPVKKVIAALHSGWKGTKENFAKMGVKVFVQYFESKPEDLLVYLSPCASGRKYEVGYDVAMYFPKTSKKINENKYFLDIREQVYIHLTEQGVQPYNIEKSDVCTIENIDYHSFRRDGKKSGRMSAFICMKTGLP